MKLEELKNKDFYTFQDLCNIMKILRKECPWDKDQTHESLVDPLIEEAYELKQAILNKDKENMCEELGDLLLQVVFHGVIGEESEAFGITDIITTLCNKLIYRHPHIFSDLSIEDAKDVESNWDALKMTEKKQESYTQVMEDVPKTLPALIRAYKVQKKASRVGFDWDEASGVFDKVNEELEEFKKACQTQNEDEIIEEFGDILFSAVNLSRFFHINPEFALTNAVEKFINRFRYIENFAKESGRSLEELTLEDMNHLWNEAKSCTQNKN